MAWVTAYPCVGATSAPWRCSGRSHCLLYMRRYWHQRPSSTATTCEFGTAARCPEPTQPGIVPECRQRLLAAMLARSCRAICTDRHQRHPACKPVPVALGHVPFRPVSHSMSTVSCDGNDQELTVGKASLNCWPTGYGCFITLAKRPHEISTHGIQDPTNRMPFASRAKRPYSCMPSSRGSTVLRILYDGDLVQMLALSA